MQFLADLLPIRHQLFRFYLYKAAPIVDVGKRARKEVLRKNLKEHPEEEPRDQVHLIPVLKTKKHIKLSLGFLSEFPVQHR